MATTTKKLKKPQHSLETKMQAIACVTSGMNAYDVADKFKIHFSTIYTWMRKKQQIADAFQAEKSGASIEPLSSTIKSDAAPVSDKRKNKVKAKAKADTSASPNAYAVKFCPCCGVNIEALAIALDVAINS